MTVYTVWKKVDSTYVLHMEHVTSDYADQAAADTDVTVVRMQCDMTFEVAAAMERNGTVVVRAWEIMPGVRVARRMFPGDVVTWAHHQDPWGIWIDPNDNQVP